MKKSLPTSELLRQLLSYEPETGKLFWRKREPHFFKTSQEFKRWNRRYANKPAFRINPQGYVSGMIFRQMHRAHRIIWAMQYGEWPPHDIDHINGDRSDNRLCNLRSVTRRENTLNQTRRRNNKSGRTGVCQSTNGKWRTYISGNGKIKHLGVFNTLEEAIKVRVKAEAEYGYHINHDKTHGLMSSI